VVAVLVLVRALEMDEVRDVARSSMFKSLPPLIDRYMPDAEGGRSPLADRLPFVDWPNEVRLADAEKALGAAEIVFVELYKVAEGTGRNVGVVGLETELESEAEVRCAVSPPEVWTVIFLGLVVLRAKAAAPAVEFCDLYRTRAEGLGERRRDLARAALSFCGDGESSMINTHPLWSPIPEFRLLADSEGGFEARVIARSISSDPARLFV
jgi:hypothetical protein